MWVEHNSAPSVNIRVLAAVLGWALPISVVSVSLLRWLTQGLHCISPLAHSGTPLYHVGTYYSFTTSVSSAANKRAGEYSLRAVLCCAGCKVQGSKHLTGHHPANANITYTDSTHDSTHYTY